MATSYVQRGGEVPPQTYLPSLPLPTEAHEWQRAQRQLSSFGNAALPNAR
jgi:hypothetical protein